ncbi:MAG TPA: TonB-dependent receptor [Bryobacterales bacterium]|nr:TonB-dependent receptor [Bryobacterales bacterium]
MRLGVRITSLLLTLLFCLSLCWGQIGTATISGRVTDPTGAVVPSVSVTIVNTNTNFKFTAATNSEGLYRVQSLQPGPYQATFDAQGFKRVVRGNIELRVGDTLPVDVTLQIGTVAEQVEVTGQTQLLETETSATGTVAEGKVLYNLPLYQRYVNLTLNLVPGMTMGGYGYGGDLGSYHVAGQRATAIGMFEDGVLGNNSQAGSTGDIKPVQNSVEEVKVLTTTLPAEYGHSAGGVINVVKKSGSNEIHGLASDFGRVRRMQHRLFFDKFRTSDPQPGSPNGVPGWFMMPDANVGGPVVIPKLYDGRNKTFFFFGYQKLIEKKAAQVFTQVPTAAMKNGDFNFGGLGNPIYDPTTTRQMPDGTWVRDPVPNNLIPASRIDPVARKMLQINPWASPNVPGSLLATGPISNYLYNEKSRTFFEDYSGRIDQQFSPNFKIYGSYTYNHQSGLGRPTDITLADFDTNSYLTPFTQQNYSVGATKIFGPTLINDARVGYFRARSDKFVPSYNKNYGQILGIPNISAALLPSFGTSTDQTSVESLYGMFITGPSRNIAETLSFRDDLTKIWGAHAFKMGYELLHFRTNSTATDVPSGQFAFDQMTAGLQPNGQPVPRTGNTFAGFLFGSVRQATFDGELTSWLPRDSINSFYFQDDWKFSPTLTLNLGVRYSNESPFHTKYNGESNFSPTAIDPLTGKVGAIAHPTGNLSGRDNNNFEPRVGMAWHPLQKWVFRGGFAVNTIDIKFPAYRDQFSEYVATAVQQQAPGDPRPIYQISQGPPPVRFNITSGGTAPFIGTNFSGRSTNFWDPNMHNPYVMNWNASIEYEINPSYLLSATYQGSGGVGLIEQWQLNTFPENFGANDPALRAAAFAAPQNYRPYPQFGDILARSNFGHSTYHSGTVQLQKRYSRGLVLNTFYTFSKAIDEQDSDNGGSVGVAPLQNRGLEKARAGYDRNHRFIGMATYELPVGRGKHFMNRGGVWNYIFGGYQIAWIQTVESGNPMSFSFANSPYNYYPTFVSQRRPDVVAAHPSIVSNWGDMGGDRFNLANINPIININDFAYPAAFTPGNSGRNIVTGTRLLWSQVSAQKNFKFRERWNVQLRWDFQNPFHNYNFNPPTTTVDFQNPKTFGKLSADQRTASVGGEALMNLTLQVTW